MAIRSFSSRTAASSRPRPDRMWARPVPSAACWPARGSWLRKPSRPATGRPPGGRRYLAAQDLEQAGLAGAVATDQAHLVAGAHQERRLLQGEATADLDAQLAGFEHLSMMADRPPGRTGYGPVSSRP